MFNTLHFAWLGKSQCNYQHISSNNCIVTCYHDISLSRNVRKYFCQLSLTHDININFYLQSSVHFFFHFFALFTSYFNCTFFFKLSHHIADKRLCFYNSLECIERCPVNILDAWATQKLAIFYHPPLNKIFQIYRTIVTIHFVAYSIRKQWWIMETRSGI